MNLASKTPPADQESDQEPLAPPDRVMMWMLLGGVTLFGTILLLDLFGALFR